MPQIVFPTLFDNFSLSINTRMISCDEMQSGSLYPEQFFPKIVGESGIFFINNRMRHGMKLEDMIHETLSHNGGGKWVLKSIEMSILGNMINYHHGD
jgi:hypothetical protein